MWMQCTEEKFNTSYYKMPFLMKSYATNSCQSSMSTA